MNTNKKSNKAKICFMIGQLVPEGAERQLLYLVQRLDRDRFDMHVCVLFDVMDLAPDFRATGAKVVCMHKRTRIDLRMLLRLISYLWKEDFHIVQTIDCTANLWGRIAAILSRTPIIIASERSVEDWKNILLLSVDRVLARKTNIILGNSRAVKEFISSNTMVPAEKCYVIYNGIDLHRFNPEMGENNQRVLEQLRNEFGLTKEGPIIGTVGSLTEAKDQRTFLRACRLVVEENPSCQFIMVGDGRERPNLIALAKELGIEHKVIFTGRRNDVEDVMAVFDVFVLSSIREGFANVILEAMAMQKPVVATDVGGNAEAVKHGKTGFIVPPQAPEALAGGIIRLIQDSNCAKQMGIAGRREVEIYYDMGRMVELYTKTYERLLNREGILS